MAGPGRVESDGGGVRDDVNERSLFVPVAEVQALPLVRPARTAPDTPTKHDFLPASGALQLLLATVKHGFRCVSLTGVGHGVATAARTELDRGAAFLLVPVFLSVGVVCYFSLAGEPDFYRPASLAALIAFVAWLTRNQPKTHLCLMAAFLCVFGFLAAKAETWRVATPMLGSEISTRLTARVVAIDHMESGRVRLTLDVLSTARPALRYAPERVRLSARALPAGARAGSTISGTVRLLPPTGPVRPGSYDYSFQSYFDGIGASGFFMSNPSMAEERPMPFSAQLSAMVENAREAIAGHIREMVGGAEGEIAAALIVGVRAGIPEAVNEAMRKTGIYHIISISGLHMALVAGIVMAMMRGAFALFPDFSSRHAVKKVAAGVALFSIAAYLVISGVVVAAERSFIMLAVMLTAVLFDRAALTMRNLAISAIAVIADSPHEVVGPSFQMSFAATAALVGAYAGWSDYRANRGAHSPPPRRSLPGWLSRKFTVGMAGLAATSIIAGGATTLYAMWHFQRVAPLSLLANLAVMPIVSAVVMPFAVLSSLAMPFGLDGPFLYVMGKGLSAMIVVAEWIAARSPVDAVGLVSGEAVLFVTVALVIATMATTWLRWAALPFALAGLMTIPAVRTPDVLVSEDGRLVALPIGAGELALNRPRASEFTIDNWRRALNAETVIAPEPAKKSAFNLANSAELPEGTPFLCADGLCVARHGSGAIVAYADNAAAAKQACDFAELIVVANVAADPCRDPLVAVITGRDLARSGSAEIFFDRLAATAPARIRYAIEENYRPWHEQRAYSREARGLPRYDVKAWRKTTRRQDETDGQSYQQP